MATVPEPTRVLPRASGLQSRQGTSSELFAVVHTCLQSILAYSLVTESGRKYLPDAALPLDADWPGPITEHFENMAKARPDLVAISFQKQAVTYATLRKLTNQVRSVILLLHLMPLRARTVGECDPGERRQARRGAGLVRSSQSRRREIGRAHV